MGWCLVQTDDRKSSELGSQAELMSRNEESCSGDQTCAAYMNVEVGENVPPYWRKVHAVRECLSRKECDSCLYLDTDAVLNTKKWKEYGQDEMESLLGGKDFSFSPDWARDRFNAGVFAVRNTEKGRQIMKEWGEREPTDAWEKRVKKWSCTSPSTGAQCIWAGDEYEQGSFIRDVLPDWESEMSETSPFVYNNDIVDCSGKVKHFSGNYNNVFPINGKEEAISTYLSICS